MDLPATALWRRDNGTATGGVVSPEDLIQKAEDHWNVSGTSVIAAWLLTAFGGILIVALYSWRRQRDPLIYIPRVAASRKRVEAWEKKCEEESGFGLGICPPAVPPVDEGFLGWLKPQMMDFWMELWYLFNRQGIQRRDEDLLELIGLDALTYIHFLRLLRWLFLIISIFAALPLVLANYYINTQSVYGSANDTSLKGEAVTAQNIAQTASDAANNVNGTEVAKSLLDNMQLFTAANITSNGMWVHIGFEWIISCLVIVFVVAHSWHHDELVRKWVEINQCEISFRSIMVTNLNIKPRHTKTTVRGKKHTALTTIQEAKIEVFSELGLSQKPFYDPGTKLPAGCSVVLTLNDMSKLSEEITKFKEERWPEFEIILTAYLRRNKSGNRDKLEYKNLWKRVMGEAIPIETLFKEKGVELSRKKLKIENEQILARGDPELEDTLPVSHTISSAFVTFRTAKEAQKTLKEIKQRHKGKIKKPDVQRAPRSKNIVWKNLDNHGVSKHGHTVPGKIFIAVVFFLNTVPLIFITLLANLDMAIDQVDYLRDLRDSSELWAGAFTVIGGVLPASIAALFGYILPYVVRWLNKWSGALTRGQLDKTVIRQLFIFQLVSNFVVFSCLGVIWETYLTIQKDIGIKPWLEIYGSLGDLPAKVTKAYISESSYWLSWFPIRAALICVQLLQLPRIFTRLLLSLTAKTGTDLHKLAQPESFEFSSMVGAIRAAGAILINTAIEYIHVLFAMAVALIYTPLAPIVTMCSTIYFWALSIVHYNQVKFVEDTKETDGKCWHVARNRLLTSAVLMQLLMTLTIGLKTKSPTMTLCAFIPVTFVLTLKQVEQRKSWFPKTSELIGLPPENAIKLGDEIPEFKHELLRPDWMPELHWLEEDREELMVARDKYEWLSHLIGGTAMTDKYEEKKEKRWKRVKNKAKRGW